MDNCQNSQRNLIDSLYRRYSAKILGYISTKIACKEDAENLMQDVWVKLLETSSQIVAETALPYIYKVAANLVNDYLRKLYERMACIEHLSEAMETSMNYTPEVMMQTLQIEQLEWKRVETLPKQRQSVYIMSRFADMTVMEIANELSLSLRTVENHLRMGRQDVRNYIRAAV